MKHCIHALLLLGLLLQPLSAQQSAQSEPKKPEAAPRSETAVKTIPIEELLPVNTFFIALTSNLAGLVEGFRRLEAARTLAARLPKADRESEENPLEQAARFLSLGIRETDILSESRVGLAYLKPDFPEAEPAEAAKKAEAAGGRRTPVAEADKNKIPDPHFVAFIEAGSPEHAAKAREQFVAYFSENFTDLGRAAEAKPVRDQKFKGAAVERFKNGYLGTIIGTTFIVGEPAAIESIIRLQQKTGAEHLSDNPEFIQARAKLMVPTGLFAWVNGGTLDTYTELATVNVPSFINSVAGSLFAPGAIKGVALASTFERDGVVDRLIVSLDPGRKNLLSTFFSGPSLDFRSTRYIPSGTQVLINHSLDFTRLYNDLIVPVVFGAMAETEAYKIASREVARRAARKGAARRGEENQDDEREMSEALEKARAQTQQPGFINTIIARMEKEYGLKFREEIVRCLANEVTIAYQIPPAAPEDKQEHLAAFIGLRDREAAKTAISKVIAYAFGALGSSFGANEKNADSDETDQPSAAKEKTEEQLRQEQAQRLALMQTLPRETYKQAEIISLMAFAIAYVEDYLVIADSTGTIKRMIDNAESDNGLVRDANFNAAMTGIPGSSGSRVYVGPKYFDAMLSSFVKAWSVRTADRQASALFNLPATAAGFAEADERTIRLEVFTPIGIPAMFVFDSFGDQLRSEAARNESEAQLALRTVATLEKHFAAQHDSRYATLDELIRFQKENPPPKPDDLKLTSEERERLEFNRDLSALREAKNNYRLELKLRPGSKGFEATATPVRYGRNARHSFFIDESGKLRRANKDGEPATASDELVSEAEEGRDN
ncbi:MAG TPA: DUF3352 domain-containing protein [Blastocatellia bacterium]|nr:DUF3352 domain-containing protein [Blastocatellia bacterium]